MRKWIKLAIGALVAFAIGFAASILDIAVPAPPALVGALLVLAMTVGYVAAGRYFVRRPPDCGEICGGPDGLPTGRPMR